MKPIEMDMLYPTNRNYVCFHDYTYEQKGYATILELNKKRLRQGGRRRGMLLRGITTVYH